MSGALDHSPADIVRKLIVDRGLGVLPDNHVAGATDWPVYAEEEPTAVDSCVTVYNSEDLAHAQLMHGGYQVESHGVQVLVRAILPNVGFPKARAIAVSLDAVNDVDVVLGDNTYIVYGIVRTSFLALGKEANSNRRHYSINALAGIVDRALRTIA